MAYDFPASPTVGQTFNNYVWDGEKWKLQSPPVTGAVRYDVAQSLNSTQRSQARANVDVTRKNYIINGAMMVSQENGTTAGTTVVFYPADEWHVHNSTSTGHTTQQIASLTPGGSPNRIRVTMNATGTPGASTALWIRQIIEGYRVADLQLGTPTAKQFTLQMGVKAPAGTYGVSFSNNTGARYYISQFVIAAGEANTDVVKTITIPGDTAGSGWARDNTVGLLIEIMLSVSSTLTGPPTGAWAATPPYYSNAQTNFMTSGNVFELFDVSLTEGTVAPPFMVPDYASELLACMRYWKRNEYTLRFPATAGAQFHETRIVYQPPMRATPTNTFLGSTATANASAPNFSAPITTIATDVYISSTGAGDCYVLGGFFSSNARL